MHSPVGQCHLLALRLESDPAKPPVAVLARRRVVIGAHGGDGVAKRDDRAAVAFFATVVDRANVAACVDRGEAASAGPRRSAAARGALSAAASSGRAGARTRSHRQSETTRTSSETVAPDLTADAPARGRMRASPAAPGRLSQRMRLRRASRWHAPRVSRGARSRRPVFMLHAGLDLSRDRLDVCLLSEHAEVVEEFAASADVDG